MYPITKILKIKGLVVYLHRLIINSVLVTLFILFSGISKAQDLSFSQFYASPLYLNPAFTGIHKANKLCLHYRNQYNPLKSYTSYAVSFDKYIDKLSSGIGIQLVKSDAANSAFQNEAVSLSYAYANSFTKKLAFQGALQVGYQYEQLDADKLIVYNQINPTNGQVLGPITAYENITTSTKKGFADINAGFLVYNQNFYSGIAVKHLTQPAVGYVQASVLPVLINVHAGYQFHNPSKLIEKSWYFTPTLLLAIQGNYKELNLGFYSGLKNIFWGISYRNTLSNADAMIFLMGIGVNNWRIGYSFDYNIATKYNVPRITHELALSYVFSKTKNGVSATEEWGNSKSSHRRMKCPKFFK